MGVKTNIPYFLLILFIVIADRTAKIFLETKAKNYGATFGILPGFNWLFVLVAIILIILVINYSRHIKSKLLKTSLFFILAGTIGNLIDRLLYGYVIDVIKIGFMPAFNISDLANTFGAVLLIAFIIRKDKFY